ncbi:hypothetical protein [Kineosporia sp. A_224]|uniref:hypothetical protein n=1 Tax=Kineosporia sp. A_224 TaxID=1962180 RepID=UPI00117A8BB8|nr:hypothetical protein [Kineosporia sp. A_224]
MPRTVIGLLVPVDPDLPLALHLLPDGSVAISDLLGGGLLGDPEVWVARHGADVRRVLVYRSEPVPDAAPNPRLAALADLLEVSPETVAPVVADVLLLGAGEDGADADVPPLVLATVLHSGWPVSMHVVTPGTDREAGDRRW